MNKNSTNQEASAPAEESAFRARRQGDLGVGTLSKNLRNLGFKAVALTCWDLDQGKYSMVRVKFNGGDIMVVKFGPKMVIDWRASFTAGAPFLAVNAVIEEAIRS